MNKLDIVALMALALFLSLGFVTLFHSPSAFLEDNQEETN